MERTLELAAKAAQEAEVFTVTSEETPAQFEANRLKHIQSKQSSYVALRIIKDGRIGYATATTLKDGESLVNAALETARFGTEAVFQFPPPTPSPKVEVFDPAVEAMPMEEMVGLGEQLIDTVRGHTPDINCEATVSKGTVSVRLLNSRGEDAGYKQSFFALGVEGQVIDDTDMLFVGDGESSCHPITSTKSITARVIEQLDRAKNHAPIASKVLPAVFTPHGVSSALISPLMAAFNGKTVLKGASPIGDKLGEKIFNTKLNLWDDPTIPYRPGSHPCDDEGTPSQRTPLIAEGKAAGFIYDLKTAALANPQSTGNGRRGGGGAPAPSPNAFVIGTGDTTFDDMVGDIKEGLVIEMLMGADQGNILSGDFSGNVLLGYKVESGKIVGRVKNTMVSGNIYQLLKDIAAVGSESRWTSGAVNTPPIYCPRLSVASK